jgi:hypothetical protein
MNWDQLITGVDTTRVSEQASMANYLLGDIDFGAAAAAPPAKKRRSNKRGVVDGESGGLTALKNRARDFATSEGWRQLKVTNSVFRYVASGCQNHLPTIS